VLAKWFANDHQATTKVSGRNSQRLKT